jgi:predicted O-methyltransferase YrrM
MTQVRERKSDDFYPMRQDAFLKKGLHDMLQSLENKIGPLSDKCIVEIGSYTGESTTIFAQHFGLVIAIDPFMDWYDENDDTCYFAPMAKVEQEFDKNTSGFQNIVKVKLTSDEAAKFAKENGIEKIDFVYIDGLHTFEQVKKDIENYLPFLNEPKIIGGHDYHIHWEGVKKAIDETIGAPDEVFCDTSWIKQIN